jgi:hypothetical protein
MQVPFPAEIERGEDTQDERFVGQKFSADLSEIGGGIHPGGLSRGGDSVTDGGIRNY